MKEKKKKNIMALSVHATILSLAFLNGCGIQQQRPFILMRIEFGDIKTFYQNQTDDIHQKIETYIAENF